MAQHQSQCSVSIVETNTCTFNFFHHWVATPLQFFRIKRRGNIPTGTLLAGASNARVVVKNRDLSQYLTPSRAVNDLTAKCNTLSCDGPWHVDDTIVAGYRRSLLMAGDDYEVFMTRSLDVTPKTTKQHLILMH